MHREHLLLTAAAVTACVVGAACGSSAGTSSQGAASQGSGASFTATPSTAGATQISVAGGSGGPNGSLTDPTAACVDQGQAGFQVTIRGTLSGNTYVFKFDAPTGATDLSRSTTADITVYLAELPGGANWGADPRAQKGSGTLTVNGNSGGLVAVHLIAGAGSAMTDPVDVSGRYACSSTSTG